MLCAYILFIYIYIYTNPESITLPWIYTFILLPLLHPCKYSLVSLVPRLIRFPALITKPYDNFIGAAAATAAAKKPAAKDTEKELYNASVSATEVATSLSASLKSHQQLKEAEQLMEIEKLRQKLESTERAMAQLVAEMNTDQYEAKVSIQHPVSSSFLPSSSNRKADTDTDIAIQSDSDTSSSTSYIVVISVGPSRCHLN